MCYSKAAEAAESNSATDKKVDIPEDEFHLLVRMATYIVRETALFVSRHVMADIAKQALQKSAQESYLAAQ